MLDQITPVILTYNEEANIGRCLTALSWAKEVVVLDSHSTDETESIARSFPNCRFLQRPFDSHAQQWRFALEETGISSPWLLRLDADYVVTPAVVEELRGLTPGSDMTGYRAAFDYCILGRKLRACLYPPNMVLVRREALSVIQDGHTERVGVSQGQTGLLANPLQHDDRKTMARFVWAQIRYQARECDKLLAAKSSELGMADRLRRWVVVAPWLVPLYCLIARGLILDGRAGLAYSLQRSVAESILSLYLIDRKLRGPDNGPGDKGLEQPKGTTGA
ncbi:glycosyltransferase family 2 protein [Rhodovibrionaceae bacterium A322]